MLNTTIAAMLGTPEIILIVAALLLLFGGKKIPELMRGLGKGVKEFKEGKDGLKDSLDDSNATPNQENKPL